MKKTLIIAGLASLTLASCSQEEVLNVASHSDNAIAFSVRTAKNTRAADITTGSLETFKVFGLYGSIDERVEDESYTMDKYFGGVDFKKTFDSDRIMDVFKSDVPYYYPADGTLVTLIAYAPADLDATVDNKGQIIVQHEVDEDITKQKDIIFDAFTSGITVTEYEDEESGEMVEEIPELYFFHNLTKVFVSGAKNTNSRYKYSVAGVKFGNIGVKGEGTIDKINWQGGSDTPDNPEWIITKEGDRSHIFSQAITIGEDVTPIMSGDLSSSVAPVGTQERGEGSFLMIPQDLRLKNDDFDYSQSVQSLVMKEGHPYIGLLLRITTGSGDEEKVIYPFAQGVDNITEEVGGIKYAWAVFPIATNWIGGTYVDYLVDFSNGAGFVAPGAEGLEDPFWADGTMLVLEHKPILGREIKLTESVKSWTDEDGDSNIQSSEVTIEQGSEAVLDHGSFVDPFGAKKK